MQLRQQGALTMKKNNLRIIVIDDNTAIHDDFIKILAMKSTILDTHIRKITLFEKRLAYNDITEDAMIELHRLLAHFYKNCK